MKNYLATALACSTVLLVLPVWAQLPTPPEIQLQNAQRVIGVSVQADDAMDNQDVSSMAPGPFVGSFFASASGSEGSTATGSVSQDTRISTFTIDGSGESMLSGDASPSGAVTGNANPAIAAVFTIPVDAPFTLSGKLETNIEGDAYARAEVTLVFTTPDGLPLVFQRFSQPGTGSEGEVVFNVTDLPQNTIKANTVVSLSLQAQTVLGTDFSNPMEAMASFDFVFDVGDRDKDGLLNAWEEDGIDIDGDEEPEIDLPAMGADPDKKDLFVEVDVMEGVTFDQAAIDDVIKAFAEAPADMVDNPDGSKGIQLHVITNGDRPGHVPLTRTPGVLPAEYYEIKDTYFGSEDDRAHPMWVDIYEARLRVFRYCLWADTMAYPPPDGSHVLGVAEAIPSNDFIVAAGRIQSRYPDIPTAKQAATFMHELGHTLNLRHGGENNENRKPNYLSVMNYAYSVPFTKTTAQGTNVADYWRLDYSRSTMIDLDETMLLEEQGLGGPEGRAVIFNSANDSDPEPVARMLWWANKSYVDWNDNGGDPKEDPYQLDITRNSSSVAAFYDSTLESYADWNRIWYHLEGTPDFEDRSAWPYASPSPALEEAEIEAFYDVEWKDATALDDLIFENGFELGSTTAWSATVP